MKRFVMVLALACALSGIALAGDVPSTGITGPPPPPSGAASPGEIPATDSTAPGDIPSVPLTVLLTILDFAF